MEEVARLEREDLSESVIKAANVVSDAGEMAGSAAEMAAGNVGMVALEQRERLRRKVAHETAQENGGFERAQSLKQRPGSLGAVVRRLWRMIAWSQQWRWAEGRRACPR